MNKLPPEISKEFDELIKLCIVEYDPQPYVLGVECTAKVAKQFLADKLAERETPTKDEVESEINACRAGKESERQRIIDALMLVTANPPTKEMIEKLIKEIDE